ncbi:MAG: magnesium transporter [Paracoccaceae bacterium]
MVDTTLSQTAQETDQGAYQLDRRDVAKILYALDVQDRDQLIASMDPLHPADIADLLEQINPYDRSRLIRLYDREFDGEILTELQEGLREEIIGLLRPDVLAEAVRDLETDDVVDLVEDLGDEQQEAILEVLDESDRVAVENSLNYPEYSAGRLMQRELVIAPENWCVGDAIDYLRSSENLPEQFYHVTLVDGKMHPVAEETFQVIPATQDEADVAYAFNQYHLISTPVVDEDGRIVGVITIDDAMVVLDEEHEEDILRLAGVGESNLSDNVLQTTWQRFPWLAVNLVTAILASLVIAQFEATIESFVALAVLMPIIASMGGNAGTQSLTVAVRALATKDLTASNVWRVIRREALVGLINGTLFAVLMGVVGLIWFNSMLLGYVIALAMVINLVTAGLAGTGVPVILERFGVDPALASGAFVTTVTDVIGFFAFLGLAAWMLF